MQHALPDAEAQVVVGGEGGGRGVSAADPEDEAVGGRGAEVEREVGGVPHGGVSAVPPRVEGQRQAQVARAREAGRGKRPLWN